MNIYETMMLYIFSFFGLFTAIFFFITFFQQRRALSSPKLKKYPKITVAVPVYNNEKYLSLTVESILSLDYPKKSLQIIIVDDGSTDKSGAIADSFKSKGIIVIHQKNKGKANALNAALKIAHGDYFACLDVDSFVSSDCPKKMLGYFNNQKVMAVTPSLKIKKPETFLQKIQMVEFLLGVYLRHIFGCLGSIHVTPGPFTIYRVDFFRKYGGYDATTLTEDIELALRIQSKDFIIENSIESSVYTLGVSGFKPLLRQRLRWYKGFLDNVINYKFLFGKEYGNLGLFILPSAFISIFSVIILCIYVLIKLMDKIISKLFELIAINFDIIPLFKFNFDYFYISTSAMYLIGLLAAIISILTIYIAKKYSKDKHNLKVAYIYFFFTYGFIFAFWWIVALYYKALGKKIRWGGRYI